jgi:Sugar (and other) transporter
VATLTLAPRPSPTRYCRCRRRCQQLSITFGIFLAALLNIGLKDWSEGWRFSYCGNGILSAALVFLMIPCPESPRWLYKVSALAFFVCALCCFIP